MSATRQVIVRMPDELHEAIKARAAVEERSMSQLVRYVMRRYLAAGSELRGDE
jgi:plasmid stability protein